MRFTPQQSEVLLTAINALCPKYQFRDCSYGNDCADSVFNETIAMQIWFPNIEDAFKADVCNEDFDTFSVKFDDDLHIDQSFTLLQVVSLVNSLDRNLTVNNIETTMLEYIKANHDNWEELLLPVLKLDVEGYIVLNMGAGGLTEVERLS